MGEGEGKNKGDISIEKRSLMLFTFGNMYG